MIDDDLKIRIDTILSRCRNVTRLISEWGSDEQKAADSLFWNDIKALNEEAGEGLQPGKHVRFSVADGYAHYIVKKIGKRNCQLVHVPYMDSYQSNLVNAHGEIDTDEIKPRIEFEEGLHKLFEMKRQRRMTVAAE